MKVYELMAFLAKQQADADVVVAGDGLLSSKTIRVTADEAGPETIHIYCEPVLDEEDPA